jgi:hypothetical protein
MADDPDLVDRMCSIADEDRRAARMRLMSRRLLDTDILSERLVLGLSVGLLGGSAALNAGHRVRLQPGAADILARNQVGAKRGRLSFWSDAACVQSLAIRRQLPGVDSGVVWGPFAR